MMTYARRNGADRASRLVSPGGAKILRLAPTAVRPWLPGLPWQCPADGDTLIGIEAIATYLGLPFLDVRTMLELGHLPSVRQNRAHTIRRTELARHFLALEAAGCVGRPIAPPPADVGPAGALGLIKRFAGMGEYLGVPRSVMRWHSEFGKLPTFRIGRHRFARAASLDHFAALYPGYSKVLPTEPDTLCGVSAIAEYLELEHLTAKGFVKVGHIPTFKMGQTVCARPAALVAHFLAAEREHCRAEYIADPPTDVDNPGALQLVRGGASIAKYIGINLCNLQHAREARGAPVFQIGRYGIARRASLDLYRAARLDTATPRPGAGDH